MAFLVCYSWVPPGDHAKHKAIYLDQKFYKMIFDHCRDEPGPYPILREVALLKYKSPTLVIAGDRLTQLDHELADLEKAKFSHAQSGALRLVCKKALSDECALTISGDMYPELW